MDVLKMKALLFAVYVTAPELEFAGASLNRFLIPMEPNPFCNLMMFII